MSTCPLCANGSDGNNGGKKSLRGLIQDRGLKPPFAGIGPDVHNLCFEIGRGVRELIAETVRQEQAAKTMAKKTEVAVQA